MVPTVSVKKCLTRSEGKGGNTAFVLKERSILLKQNAYLQSKG